MNLRAFSPLLTAAIGLGLATVAAAIVGLAFLAFGVSSSGGSESASVKHQIARSAYGGGLASDEEPGSWVRLYPIVALVTVNAVEAPRWSTDDLAAEGKSGDSFIYTPLDVTVQEYIKGAGPASIVLAHMGGKIGDTQVTFSDYFPLPKVGEEAVVFVMPPAEHSSTWNVWNAYVVSNGVASSELDGRQLPASELLDQLRAAAQSSAD